MYFRSVMILRVIFQRLFLQVELFLFFSSSSFEDSAARSYCFPIGYCFCCEILILDVAILYVEYPHVQYAAIPYPYLLLSSFVFPSNLRFVTATPNRTTPSRLISLAERLLRPNSFLRTDLFMKSRVLNYLHSFGLKLLDLLDILKFTDDPR